MPEPKTKPTAIGPQDFLNALSDSQQREEAFHVLEMMRDVTGHEPEMWGSAIIGFGRRQVQGASGTAEWFFTGFSPRKGNLSIYIMSGFEEHPELMARLGKYKTGKSCLYIKRLSDVDIEVLADLIHASAKDLGGG